jgi:aspartate/methionine/tyrosine aminotransferase
MLNVNDLNKKLLEAQYAVRGKIVIKAQELEEQGKKIIYCNIGNPQALKQKPMTYVREVLSLMEFPDLLNDDNFLKGYHKDSVERARFILKNVPGGVGAYSQSAGIPFIRKAVAEFIEKRDNIPAEKERIILTDGASKGVQAVIMSLLKNENDGVMIPIPQYPLYSATLTLYGGKQVDYYLDEQNSWQLNEKVLEDSFLNAKKNGINPVAISVINPGNPTGAVLSYDNIKMILNFAKKYNLSVLADEVYQENIYREGLKFYSFAKVAHDLGITDVPLFSFHSMSKGYLGECGHRAGYFELRNIPQDVLEQFIKLQSISLCSNVIGQIATYLMVSPPKEGDESFELYVKEKDGILKDLKTKAEILGKGLNAVNGMTCEIPQGAMYAFVKFELPHKQGVDPLKLSEEERLKYESGRDNKYCMQLLEETGICVVPGSGFGQLPNTLHFRTTFLPPRDEIETLVEKMKEFHIKYINNPENFN